MAFLSTIARSPARLAARWRAVVWLAVVALAAGVTPPARAQAAAIPEYRLKAEFLVRLAQFVSWPAAAFHGPQSPLVVGVLGDDPFGKDLDEAVSGGKIDEHPVVVKRYRRIEDVSDCHILFVGSSEAGKFETIFTRLLGHSVLTVGDVDDFNRSGGMVRFTIENNKIRLRINNEAAKAAELTINSRLLRLATIVTREKE